MVEEVAGIFWMEGLILEHAWEARQSVNYYYYIIVYLKITELSPSIPSNILPLYTRVLVMQWLVLIEFESNLQLEVERIT